MLLSMGAKFQASYNFNPDCNHKTRAESCRDKKHAPENPQMQTVHARNFAPVQIQLWLQQKPKPPFPPKRKIFQK